MKSRHLWILLATTTLPLGCKASMSGEANASSSGEANADLNASASGDDSGEPRDFDKPIDPSVDTLADFDAVPAEVAPIGARQDLMFKGPGKISCRCMSVALGSGSDSVFEWGGKAPSTDPTTQLVIGFSSTSCEGAPGDVKASYWGYETSGDDVVVVVENSHEGRPVTVGAIIPKPLADGKVYLRPLSKGVPFARGEGGRCDLGNPGPRRTSAAGPGPQSGITIDGKAEAPSR